ILSPELEAFLEDRKRRVEEALAAQVRAWKESVPAHLLEAMEYSLLGGGKRIRPILSLAAFEACGGPSERQDLVMDFAVALECVHTYSLVHDDLPAMDDDDLRRGRPTCHVLFGEATAILAGDALLTEAFALLADGDEPERARLVGILARAAGAAGMVGGQQLDLLMAGRPDLAEVEEVHRRKTGALLRASLEGGAVAAGAAAERVAALCAYGEALGLAFQIADDILDVVGDPAKMGKRTGGDQAKGKPTYPALVGLERARQLAREAQMRAIAALEGMGEEADALRALAAYVVERAS